MKKSLRKRLIGRLGDRPAQLAFYLANRRWVTSTIDRRYAKAVQAHADALPVLSPADQEIVENLERNGYCITSLEALSISGTDAMFSTAKRVAEDCAETAHVEVRDGREFTCASPAIIAENPEIFAWGLNDRLLDIAEAYIGLPVAYDGLTLLYTVADGREVATRQWHRDREDRKMLKIAIYCNDVAEGGGPFQVIPRLDMTQGGATGYRYAGGAHEELSSLLGEDYPSAIVTCKGAAGTVIFVDTARYFHRGEPAYAEDRKAIFYSYFAQKTRHPFFCARSGLSHDQLEALAQAMPARQRSSVLWQKSQPLWMKLIPPAPV